MCAHIFHKIGKKNTKVYILETDRQIMRTKELGISAERIRTKELAG